MADELNDAALNLSKDFHAGGRGDACADEERSNDAKHTPSLYPHAGIEPLEKQISRPPLTGRRAVPEPALNTERESNGPALSLHQRRLSEVSMVDPHLIA